MATNKKPGKKYNPNKCKTRTNTPVNIRYNQDDDGKLKLPPHMSLELFILNKGTMVDWDTLNFRVRIGKHLSVHFNSSSFEVDFDHGLWILSKMKEYFNKAKVWHVTHEHISDLRDILYTTDLMQDNTTRLIQLDTHYAVQKELKIGKFKNQNMVCNV